MAGKHNILITGVSGTWGSRLANKLLHNQDYHVLGVDAEPPNEHTQGLDFIQTDIRNSLLPDLLRSESVEIVCHLAFQETTKPSETSFDVNVMGTMKVLGACAEAGVRKVVLKSSTMVYGAVPTNPAFINEDQPLRGSRTYGYVRDQVEIESFCNGYLRQAPEMQQTILRFANIIGPTADSPLTRFLREPFTPTLLGFDPMIQVIHEDDVVRALEHAIVNDLPGVYNVAAEGIMPFSKLMGQTGKISVPIFHLFLYWGNSLISSASRSRLLPFELDYLRYPYVGDLKRMREQFCFSPHYAAEEALREFASRKRMSRYLSESKVLSYGEELLRDTIERRRRIHEQEVGSTFEMPEEEVDEQGN